MYCKYCMAKIPDGARECPCCRRDLTVEEPPHHLSPGTVLQNRYIVGSALGEGGFGITYIGKNKLLDMKVAIKEYFPNGFVRRDSSVSTTVTGFTADGKEVFAKGKERFLSEAQTLGRFSNEEGIVSVYDFFEENDTAYIVMEYLEGQTLKSYLESKGKLSPEETLALLTPTMRTLEKVHKAGLIHRDVSPDNVMLTNGKVKLLDFGAARDVSGEKSLSVMLKHGYAPEEQYRRKGAQGPWTDVYALCATIYKCITGVTPDDAPDRMDNDELKPPSALGIDVDKTFEAALMKGLSVRARDRYQSVGELLDGFAGKDQSLIAAAAAAAPAAAEIEENVAPQTSEEDSASADKTVYGGAVNTAQPDDADKTVYGGAVNTTQPDDADKTVYGGAVNTAQPDDADKTVYGGAVPPQPPPKEPPKGDAGGQNKEKKKSKKGLLIGLIAAVAAIAAIVVTIVLIAGSKKPETTKDGPTKAETATTASASETPLLSTDAETGTVTTLPSEVVNTTPDTSTLETPTPSVHTHVFGEWTTVKAAACTEEGAEERVCECGEKETRTIAALGHNYENGVCTRCGDAIQKGDIITFGSYEQDNVTSNGEEAIEWIVLDVVNGKALLLSKYALDCQPYNTEYVNVTWETCTLRNWLNSDFYNTAFNASEKTKIQSTTLVNANNPNCGTNGGNNTTDKVFLLSLSDINNTNYGFASSYFDDDVARRCQPTAYAKAQGCFTSTTSGYEGNCWWWRLRSPGDYSNSAAEVRYDGYVDYCGGFVNNDNSGVRPVLWIDLESSTQETPTPDTSTPETPTPIHTHAFGKWTIVKAATCTEDGTEERVCDCGEKETRPIAATGHSYGDWVVTKEPTDTSDGIETKTCTVCGDKITRTVEKIKHNYVATVVKPTCTEQGYTTYRCSDCGKEYKDDYTAALGHNWGTPTYTWSGDQGKCTATCTCKRDASHTQNETVNTTSSVTKAATCETAGSKTYTATFTNALFTRQTKTETIAALGHNWGTPSYSWTSDKSKVTATCTCTRDASHKQTETVNTTVTTTAATCTAAGSKTYTATFTNSLFKKQTKTETIAALGHNYVNGVCTRCGEKPGAPSLVVSNTTGKVGNTVTVTISIQNNPGIWGADIHISLDTGLTLTGVTYSNGSGLIWTTGAEVNTLKLSSEMDGFDDTYYNGVIATLTLKIGQNVSPGTSLKATVWYNGGDIINADGEDVDFTIIPGSVTVTG